MKPGLAPDWPFMPNDWLSSTAVALMTPSEEGAYFRLLCHAWNDENCCLPDDDASLAALSRLGEQWSKGSGAKIRKCFTTDPDRPGFIFNERQRNTREDQMSRIQSVKDARSKAAKARWGSNAMHEQCTSNANAEQKDMQRYMQKHASSPVSPLPSPVTHTQSTPKPPEGASGRDISGLIKLEGRISRWFKRKETTKWTDKEFKALKAVWNLQTPAEDVDLLEAYYTATIPADLDIRRRDIVTLLNNWNGEIDRARRWKDVPTKLPASVVMAQIRSLEERISKHPANRDSVYFKDDCTEEQKADLKALKAKLAELKQS